MADSIYPIEIMLSGKKLTRSLKVLVEIIVLVIIAFVVFVFLMGNELGWRDLPFMMIPLSAMIALALLGIGFVYRRYYKQRHNRPGLVIDAEGLLDNFAKGGPLRIWRRDIAGVDAAWGRDSYVGRHYVPRENLIVLKLVDPKEYIKRQRSFGARKVMQINLKMYGSPICFNDDILDIKFKDLVMLLEREFGPKDRDA